VDLWDLLRVLVRRWWVTVPLLALTAAVALTLGGRESTTFKGTASLVLALPGNDGANGEAVVNPLASLGAASQFGGLVGAAVDSPATRNEIAQAGGSPDFDLGQGKGSPTLVIGVTSDRADVAQRTVTDVLERVQRQVVVLQDQLAVPQDLRFSGQVVVPPIVTSTTASSTRVLLAIVAAGLLLTALAALAVEALLSARRRRPQREPQGRRAGVQDPADGPPLPVASRSEDGARTRGLVP